MRMENVDTNIVFSLKMRSGPSTIANAYVIFG